jgi:hypothetical protein
VSLAQVVVLVVLILLAASVPLPFFPPVHVIGPADVFALDFALTCAVPWSERPGVAKVTTPGPPVHVVDLPPAAEALPLIATCAAPTEITGTALRATTAMNFRNNYSTPNYLLEADGRSASLRCGSKLLPVQRCVRGQHSTTDSGMLEESARILKLH